MANQETEKIPEEETPDQKAMSEALRKMGENLEEKKLETPEDFRNEASAIEDRYQKAMGELSKSIIKELGGKDGNLERYIQLRDNKDDTATQDELDLAQKFYKEEQRLNDERMQATDDLNRIRGEGK